MYNIIDLTGRHIVVTGASSGIGRVTSTTLSRLGAKISLVARREKQLKETLALLEGSDHRYYVSDLSELNGIDELVQKIVNEQGVIDGLVYAAGISIISPLRQFTPEKVATVFGVNYFGFMEITRQVSKKGRFGDGLSIVGISSISSLRQDPSNTAYSASKAAMNATVRNLAKELYVKKIRINAVAPAMVDTEMYKIFLENNGESSDQGLKRQQFMGIIEPQHVSNLISFLISPASGFMTGLTIPIDGGSLC